MTDQPVRRRPRWGTTALLTALAAVIVVAVAIGVLTAAGAPRPAATTRPVTTSSASPSAGPTESASPAAAPSPTATKAKAKASPKPAAAPAPQPTKTATITKPTVIVKSLTAKVTKMEAVQGTAEGPGEIAGPSVRFTIAITNTTGKTFTLSNTVVNAYYGADATPAVELRMPGGRSFPTSVKNGASATGVFLFNIPKSSRAKVEVTVDTSVRNPVVAFKGSAPE